MRHYSTLDAHFVGAIAAIGPQLLRKVDGSHDRNHIALAKCSTSP